MNEPPVLQQSIVGRVGLECYIVFGVLAGFFILLTLLVTLRRPDEWPVLAAVCAATLIGLTPFLILRLEISHRGIRYRTIYGTVSLKIEDVQRAYFTVIHSHYTPQGVAFFWLRTRQGKRMRINFNIYPERVGAVLFNILDSRGIAVEVPEFWAAQRMAKEIRDCQDKLRSGQV